MILSPLYPQEGNWPWAELGFGVRDGTHAADRTNGRSPCKDRAFFFHSFFFVRAPFYRNPARAGGDIKYYLSSGDLKLDFGNEETDNNKETFSFVTGVSNYSADVTSCRFNSRV